MVRFKDSNIRREIRKRDRFRRIYLKLKTALSQTIFKQQRNRVNNLKKQLKEKFYTNINENLNELKTINTEFSKCVSPVRHDQQNLGRFC